MRDLPARPAPIDYVALAEYLAALAYPLRLEILDMLRFPHTLSEIQLSPHRGEARVAARQTVQGHLDKLQQVDLVRAEPRAGDARGSPEYTVNPLKLYEITEEMRRLSLRHAGGSAGGDATGTLDSGAPALEVHGPRLVLVHGVYEGKAFSLDDPSADGDAGWTVGRRRGLAVALDYDPFVSVEHARVARRGGGFEVIDLGSKNGTSVNWSPLRANGSRVLRPGDVVGVGRSLLSFVPA